MSSRQDQERALVPVGQTGLAGPRDAVALAAQGPGDPTGPCHTVRVPRYRGNRRWDYWRRWAFRGVDVLRDQQTQADQPPAPDPPPQIDRNI